MTRDWESTFSNWTGRASDTEQDRYEWTRNAIKEALSESPDLRPYSFEIYAKGSYPNFTNVVRDSDVDVAAELTELYKTDFYGDAKGLDLAAVGGIPYSGTYDLPEFKDDVERALRDKFGEGPVDRGKKAIHIRESRQGLAADVVPCVTHKAFYSQHGSHQGIQLRNDAKPYAAIVNYPKQHLERGTEKNDRTQRRYKRVVRILKRLENEMVEKGVIAEVPSFLIESAVYNVPDPLFNVSTWRGRVQNALGHIYEGTETNDCVGSDSWLEANGIKYLFHATQTWTHQQASEFALKAWRYADLGE
ncbi:MAG: hypothetical protein GEU28_13955 [Dehalococcoidia bacterium]|nr:hypothetical protein [Dehalococcoidia bacterium]